MTEKEIISEKIRSLEAELKPLQERQREIWAKEHKDCEAKIERVYEGKDAFELNDLVFAAYDKCPCGAGLAYPKNIGIRGFWDCSDLLLNRAIPKGEEGSKTHTAQLPFMFYEIKSENQPSAKGATTRPKE
jgi:hypothetical protein